MLAYYIQLGLRSLRRNKALTILMVLIIGFGVAASMTTWSVFRAVSGDPIPEKSAKLFVPQVDNWGPKRRSSDGNPPEEMDYRCHQFDARASRPLSVGDLSHRSFAGAGQGRSAPLLRRRSRGVR
jgi:hypothetical protein